MTRIRLYALFLMLSTFFSRLNGQEKAGYSLEIFPPGHALNPVRSAVIEPRMGILYYPVDGTLKVDIGNSIDLAKIIFRNSSRRVTIGADFMAYANAINYRDFRLQIRAMDGFFGGHLIYSPNTEHPDFHFRLRYIHNSSHLVDGNYDVYTNTWLDNRKPLAVARDFIEGTLFLMYPLKDWYIHPYGGLFFSTLLRPRSHKRFNAIAGVEANSSNAAPVFLNQPAQYFISYYAQLSGVPKYQLTHEIQAGVKYGHWLGKGVTLYLNYFNGTNLFHIFYYQRVSRAGIGFTLDFP